jgi:hypothetical protein
MPMPADRPFELGHDEIIAQRQQVGATAAITNQPIAPVAAQTVGATAPNPRLNPNAKLVPKAAESDEWERGFASRFAPANLPVAPAGPGAVSAFATPMTGNGAVVTGRGLY